MAAGDSLGDAKAELFALLAVDSAGTPVVTLAQAGATKVYDHEPASGDNIKPRPITISTGGAEPDSWIVLLRCYAYAADGAKADQGYLDAIAVAADALLDSRFGPSNFEVLWRDDLQCFVSTQRLVVGRQDYF